MVLFPSHNGWFTASQIVIRFYLGAGRRYWGFVFNAKLLYEHDNEQCIAIFRNTNVLVFFTIRRLDKGYTIAKNEYRIFPRRATPSLLCIPCYDSFDC